MTYSIEIQAKTKAEAKEQITAQMNAVAQDHPSHSADHAQAAAAACAYVDLLPDDDALAVHVTVNGSLGGANFPTVHPFTNAQVRISAWLVHD